MEFSIRPAEDRDIPGMAAIRAQEWESEAYWTARIGGYLRGERHPQHALAARTAFVAISEDGVIGFVAGHRTQRFGCDGELEWINVAASCRGWGVSGKLLQSMAAWFIAANARRVCVNVAPENMPARRLYARRGAVDLNPFWMIWQDISKALEE